MEPATPIRRLFANLLDAVLFFLTLIIGYLIWWLIVLRQGQTPGKQLLSIRAIKRDGQPAGWGTTFVREVVKMAAHSFVIGFFADAILLLLDDTEHRSMSDRVANTIIVGPGAAQASESINPTSPV